MIFDLDETLLDYSASGEKCWNELFGEYAPQFGVDESVLRATHKQVSDRYWADPERNRLGRQDLRNSRREVIRQVIDQLGLNCFSLGEEMADSFTERREPLIYPFPGVLQTLQTLKDHGFRMALVTNGASDFQRNKIKRFNLEVFFDPIIVEGEFGVGKPDPSVFLAALADFGVGPSEACMVGDDFERDIHPALELGMTGIWINQSGIGLHSGELTTKLFILKSVNDLLYEFGIDENKS
jgi:putative hydrolase of the HAD superfamily